MQIILSEDVPHVGKSGQLVRVADGFARNFLLPRQLAVEATEHNRRHLDHQQRVIQKQVEKRKKEAGNLVERLAALEITVAKPAGAEGKLYGSVTSRDIETALAAAGIRVDRRRIALDDSLRRLGDFVVPIKLSPDHTVEIKVHVVKK